MSASRGGGRWRRRWTSFGARFARRHLLKEFYIDEKEESDDDDDQSESESGDNTDGADDIVAKGTIGGFNADGDGPLVHAVGSEAECDKIEQSIQRRVAHRSAAM